MAEISQCNCYDGYCREIGPVIQATEQPQHLAEVD